MQRRVCRLTKVREAGCIVESGEARIKFDIQRSTYPWVDTSWAVSCSCLGDHTDRSAWVDCKNILLTDSSGLEVDTNRSQYEYESMRGVVELTRAMGCVQD
jgi:hypothetical protein